MNPIVKRLLMGLAGFMAAFAAALSAMDGGGSLTLSQIGDVPLLSWVLSMGAFFTGFMNENTFSGSKAKTTSTLMVLFMVPIMLIGCASLMTPKNTQQQIFAVESSIPTTANIAKSLLERGRITAGQAENVEAELQKARQAISVAKISLAEGNTATAEGKLQTASTILQALERALQAAQDGGGSWVPPDMLYPDLVAT